MDKEQLRTKVYGIFSNRNMFLLALIAVPIVVVEFLDIQNSTLLFFDWLIWLAFLLEFILKSYVDTSPMAYITKNKLDSALSIIIIVSPLLVLAFVGLIPIPIFALLRSTTRAVRFLAYADKAKVKNDAQDVQGPVYGKIDNPVDDRFKPPTPP